jgi:hypothetical protein
LSLAAVFVTSLVVGDLIGGKLIAVPLFGSVHRLSADFTPRARPPGTRPASC